ncbi:tRNA (guanine37-N1)-methyltransferase [Rubricella aquisinus]|uniref:tRNA (guanine-N(1)-)-methyltransferase n=1 Tax=Rubricella aquisinus TaxID=2028108 RepID=A0A840X5T4_9RHOB|nr:tRNA (guanosine(37)-N1)-methyltransferase TrmD [Rubricella aquisinus]MBB5517136.1 tRNA (guanine37-N1)-methyltransferase [Rubricella aquisinus]
MSDKPFKSHGRLSIAARATPSSLMDEAPHVKGAFSARVVTLYPEMFPGTLDYSLIGKARQEGLWHLDVTDMRSFGQGKHRTVDDTPTGGGAGMVLKPDVVAAAISAAQAGAGPDHPIIYLSPRGVPFSQKLASRLAQADGMTLLCGRFEGVDQRVIDRFGMIEVSLGDFVMTGGEIAAQALIDATVRLIPRVLGNAASAEDESFSNGLLEYPQYTRPNDWDGRAVPEVLLSGHHGRIAAWRADQSERLTKERRPDLWRAYAAQADTDPTGDQQLSDAQTFAAKGDQKDD